MPSSNRHRHGRRGRAEDDLFRASLADAKPDYKTQALCKQVARIVHTALAGLCRDAVLQDLSVAEVQPAPHAGRLLVTLHAGQLAGAQPLAEVYARLECVHGLLRREVGATVTRKRIPELAFLVVRRPDGPPPDADAYEPYPEETQP